MSTTHQTIWQTNAGAFSAKPASYIDQERRSGINAAMEAIREGRPGYALFKLARSVERQNRIAGGGTVHLPVGPACGLACDHPGAVR